eukprot:COSAG06_NODE_4368_length_4327_cov_2.873463_5_plen_141_part_00
MAGRSQRELGVIVIIVVIVLVIVFHWVLDFLAVASSRAAAAAAAAVVVPSGNSIEIMAVEALVLWEPDSGGPPPEKKTASQVGFLSFPYVCPEPVLVKRSHLYINIGYTNGSKRPLSHTSVSFMNQIETGIIDAVRIVSR